MKPHKSAAKMAPAELALRYQRLRSTQSELDLDEAALLAVVTHYRRSGVLEEAYKVVRRALKKFPFSTRLYLAKAKVLADLSIFEDALEALDAADTYGPGTPQVSVQRAEVFAALGRHEDAFAELDRLGEVDDPILRSARALAEATVFEQMGRYDDMYTLLERAIREWPGNEDAHQLMWVCTELTGRHANTESICDRVLHQDPFNAQAWYNHGHASYAQGKTHEALTGLEFATLADPRFELAYREAGEICFETGLYARAIEVYETMMEHVKCDDAVLLRLGQCYLHTESLHQARLCINRVLTQNPKHDEALYYSGLLYVGEGNYLRAARDFRRAVKVNDRNEEYSAALADALAQLGDLTRAEHYFRKAADTAPELGEHWLNLVVFLYGTGRTLDALTALDDASDNTYDLRHEYCRIVLMISLGREAEALRMLAELLQEGETEFDGHPMLFTIEPKLQDHDLVTQVIRCFA